jgi:hypothetical protein
MNTTDFKLAAKNVAMKTVSGVLGTVHTVSHGIADLAKEAESVIICKIDKGSDPALVKKVRNLQYRHDKRKVVIGYKRTKIAILQAQLDIYQIGNDIGDFFTKAPKDMSANFTGDLDIEDNVEFTPAGA